MNLSREDKIAVAARNFYDDQVGTEDAFDNYEKHSPEMKPYREALAQKG